MQDVAADAVLDTVVTTEADVAVDDAIVTSVKDAVSDDLVAGSVSPSLESTTESPSSSSPTSASELPHSSSAMMIAKTPTVNLTITPTVTDHGTCNRVDEVSFDLECVEVSTAGNVAADDAAHSIRLNTRQNIDYRSRSCSR